VDGGWVDAGTRRSAVYANLTAGHYRFHVSAIDGENTSRESSIVWQFSIAPRFYETPWFYIVCSVTLVMLVWLAWRMRVRQMRAQFSLAFAERARLSREIHDTLLQGMVGVSLQFDALSSSPQLLSPDIKKQLLLVRHELHEYIREARQAIHELRSPGVLQRDLSSDLRAATERLVGPSLSHSVRVVGSPRPCAPAVQRHLLRIAREAILNCVRHAKATRLDVVLCFADDSIVLKIIDNGCGFELDEALGVDGHFGLTTMRERAEEAGGTLSIESTPGQGTRVEAVVAETLGFDPGPARVEPRSAWPGNVAEDKLEKGLES
jgi:signal transduction histidine kinase